MARIEFTGIHSVTVEGDQIVVKTFDAEKRLYEWVIARETAALLTIALEGASKGLPDTDRGQLLATLGFQPIVGPGMVPGLQIQLTPELFLNLMLPGSALASLRACIAQLESGTSFGSSTH